MGSESTHPWLSKFSRNTILPDKQVTMLKYHWCWKATPKDSNDIVTIELREELDDDYTLGLPPTQ